jgi:hypothetical protein
LSSKKAYWPPLSAPSSIWIPDLAWKDAQASVLCLLSTAEATFDAFGITNPFDAKTIPSANDSSPEV